MTRKEEQLRKAMLHYLEGSIHPEELEVLNRVVETDPDARREMAELMLQDALLTKVGQETEFFELDDPRPMPLPSVSSCRTSRIMKITRRAPIVEAPAPARRPSWKVAIAAAAVLFAVSVATAVLQSGSFDAVPVTTVQPIVPAAPAAAAPPEEPPAEAPAKAVVNAPAATKPAPAKPKAPAAKPKTSTARQEPTESRPVTSTNVPDGFLTLPSSSKLPPPSPSKPAPKLPPKTPPPKTPPPPPEKK